MSEITFLSNVRLSFPKLIEATASQPGATPKFSADFIMAPSHSGFAAFMGEVGKMAAEKWKEHATAVLQVCQTDRKLRCFGNGAEKVDKKTYKPYTGYDGMVYISANSNADRPPKIMKPDGTEATTDMERLALARKLYGGCYVDAAIRCWPQDNQFGRAARCELIAVQFKSDGEPFGEADADVTGMFGAAPAAGATPAAPAPFPSFFGLPQQ